MAVAFPSHAVALGSRQDAIPRDGFQRYVFFDTLKISCVISPAKSATEVVCKPIAVGHYRSPVISVLFIDEVDQEDGEMSAARRRGRDGKRREVPRHKGFVSAADFSAWRAHSRYSISPLQSGRVGANWSRPLSIPITRQHRQISDLSAGSGAMNV
jgi:hypothetical protein